MLVTKSVKMNNIALLSVGVLAFSCLVTASDKIANPEELAEALEMISSSGPVVTRQVRDLADLNADMVEAEHEDMPRHFDELRRVARDDRWPVWNPREARQSKHDWTKWSPRGSARQNKHDWTKWSPRGSARQNKHDWTKWSPRNSGSGDSTGGVCQTGEAWCCIPGDTSLMTALCVCKDAPSCDETDTGDK